MPILQQQQAIDIAKAFSTGVPVSGQRISMTSGEVWDLLFVLTHDTNTFPIRQPYPRFAVFDAKGNQLVSLTFAPGTVSWNAESPVAGRVGWRIAGDNPGFDVITTLHKQELRWRILGMFEGQREITLIQGQFDYTRTGASIPGGDPGTDDELAAALEMFLQFKAAYPYFYTEYTWVGDGELEEKVHYTDPGKTTPLFRVGYLWDATTGNLARKTIRRVSDNETLVLRYAWNPDDTLHSVTRSKT